MGDCWMRTWTAPTLCLQKFLKMNRNESRISITKLTSDTIKIREFTMNYENHWLGFSQCNYSIILNLLLSKVLTYCPSPGAEIAITPSVAITWASKSFGMRGITSWIDFFQNVLIGGDPQNEESISSFLSRHFDSLKIRILKRQSLHPDTLDRMDLTSMTSLWFACFWLSRERDRYRLRWRDSSQHTLLSNANWSSIATIHSLDYGKDYGMLTIPIDGTDSRYIRIMKKGEW